MNATLAPERKPSRPSARPTARVWQAADLLLKTQVDGSFIAHAWAQPAKLTFDAWNVPEESTAPVTALPAPGGNTDLGLEDAGSVELRSGETPSHDLSATPETPGSEQNPDQKNNQNYDQGYAQGKADAETELRETIRAELQAQQTLQQQLDDTLVTALKDTLTELRGQPSTVFEPLKRLSLHIAEQLVLAELRLDGSAIDRLVQRCVDELGAHPASIVRVELHPDDLLALQSLLARADLADTAKPSLVANDGLLPGSVRASANDALVEDLIGERLSAIARGLGVNDTQWRAQSALTSQRLAADRMPSIAVEDIAPRMESSIDG